ncbi:putative 6-hydroxy-D-nicotine oxidase [Glarea lozoyensis 74030]|uniref:Putative 6-hydroxy-D-nicotine oxidase n=1 Tax=Glarea lozoyensis (strain ATCC 74030 / MF5533) TaxID=1104152 RepID=H0EP35_GLAL7|nr:putative 6-hydroxy-D-nicotine oxidase [Glarea lozoyensis 74030]
MVSLNSDRTVAKVGAGNNWYDVYKVLDPLGISVVGGREAGVGVGGLLLGGGISYFSGRYGWGCDNVLNYEVVLANGKIVNASPYRNAALYWALRGGSGTNFGIVSRFDLGAFEQGLLWGGNRFYLWDNKDVLVDTFAKFIVDAPMDEFAHLYISFGYNIQLGGFAGIAGPAYGRAISNATIFEDLNKIPVLFDTTHIASMGVLAVELNQTDFLRKVESFPQPSHNCAKIDTSHESQLGDVFSGYGQKSLTRLKVVQKKYDPTGVFKRLQPGYFKL